MFWQSPALRRLTTNWLELFEPGTKFIYFITLPLSQTLQLNFWTGCVIFSTIGFLGICYYLLLIVKHIEFNPKIFGVNVFPFLLFMPNLHFWSVGIGKDALMFFAITLFFYSISEKVKWPGVLLALFITYFIRPHMTFILILATAITAILSSDIKTSSRFIVISFMLIGAYLMSDELMQFLKVEDLSYGALKEVGDFRMYHLSKGETGSKVDMANYPFPYKIFTFLYRPLFYDINNVLAIVASFENLFYLLLSFKLFKANPIKHFSSAPFFIKAGVIALLASAVAFTGFLSNLGIILRMKNMVMFLLVLFVLFVISEYHRKNIENQY